MLRKRITGSPPATDWDGRFPECHVRLLTVVKPGNL